MGLSYNPSSFATNKTILEAIEELKKYLTQNPLACIYQVPGSVQVDTSSLYLTSITIPDGQEIKAGDLLIAMNGYYNFVDSVSETNVYFVDNWCNLSLDVQSITLNFDSTYGEVVDTPANFTAWIYRRFPRTSDRYYRGRRYYLEITYKDSTAFPTTQTASIFIPANYLNAIWYQLNVDNSTTIYFDFTEDPEHAEYQLTNFTIPAGVDGTNGQDGVSITGATIDASNHLILTLSDGNTIDAGEIPTASGFENYVEINTTSGTFTDSQYAKLVFNDSVIVYDNGTYKTIYKKKIETSSIIEFESIDASARQNLKLIDVNKGTKAFSSTGISMITSSTFDSGTATSGKVLTANGSGGTSWETASSSMHVETITSTSGTFSATQVANLQNADGIIVYTHGIYNDVYTKFRELDTTIEYTRFVSGSLGCNIYKITITKSTGAYSQTSEDVKSPGIFITSSGATAGQVLTADGSNGASWQTPSGGSLYHHSVSVYQNGTINIVIDLLLNNNTNINTNSALTTALQYYGTALANGYVISGGNSYQSAYAKFYNFSNVVYYVNGSAYNEMTLSSGMTFTDTIKQIL